MSYPHPFDDGTRLQRWLRALFPKTMNAEWWLGRSFERNRILNDAWWFSHDAPTMELVRDLAESRIGVSEARSRWHRATGKGRRMDGPSENWASAKPERGTNDAD